jgi:hypothetical protein
MAYKKPWRVAGLLALGILVGYVVGPPIVQAASSLVTIQGAGSTHKARVDASGRLSVNTEASVTKANQLLTTEAAAGSAVVAFSFPTCPGGMYTIPAGKALIITGVNFYMAAAGPGSHQLLLQVGPAATPCGSFVAAGLAGDTDVVTYNQAFHPGIPVPAGNALGLTGINESGSAEVYGYLVPASAVPASALGNLPKVHGGRSPTTSRS